MGETEVKTISPSTLGRYRKKYDLMRTDKDTKKLVSATVKLDLKLLNKQYGTSYTLDDFTAMLEKLNKPTSAGKREADKLTRDQLITETQDMLSVVNLAVGVARGNTTLTPKQKQQCFDKLGEVGGVLTDHLKTAFTPIGGMSMLWNPSSQLDTASDGLAVYIGGWEDGSKNPRYQYAPRKCPISKRSGYRDDSFAVNFYTLPVPPAKPIVTGEVVTTTEPIGEVTN